MSCNEKTKKHTDLADNFYRLVGTLGIDSSDLDSLRRQCAEMKSLDYFGVYFNNIFFTIEDVGFTCPDEDVLFREDDCLVVRRPEKELQQIRDILHEHELHMPSAHFLHMLPEPGQDPESIFTTHKKILTMAAFMGAERLTTHVGSIAVPQAANASKRPTPAELLRKGEVTYAEYVDRLNESYGRESILTDSLTVYRHLCAEAEKQGITITIETACRGCYEISNRPRQIAEFIQDVGADNLGVCLDSGHCHLNHLSIPEIIRGCGSLLLETHFHDNFGDGDRHSPVGIGTINWLDTVKAMHENGYQGEITFEQGDYRTNHRNWMLFMELVEEELNQ